MYRGVQNVRIDGQIMGYNGLSNGNGDILSKLQPGDTIRALVINTTGNEAVLKLSDGTKFTANTLNPQQLKTGEHMNFSVKGFSDGRLVLETVKNTVQQAEADPLASIRNTLSEQNIPATEENLQIAKALTERNVPITRESVAQTAAIMKANSDIKVNAASFLTATRMNDDGNIEKLKNLLAGRLKIGNDINQLVKLINQHLTGDFSQELSDIRTNLTSLLNNRNSSSQQTNLILQQLTQLLGELSADDGLSNSMSAMAKGASATPATTGATANPAATSATAGQPNAATGTATDVAASDKAAAGSASANTANAGPATATQSGAQNSATAPLAGQNNVIGAQAGPNSAAAQTAQAAATLNVDSAKLDAVTTGGTAAGIKAADPQQAGNVQGGIPSVQGQNTGVSAAQAQNGAQNVAQTAAQVGDGAGASVQAQNAGGAGAMQGQGGASGTVQAQNAAGALAQGGNRPEQRIGEPSDNKALISRLDSLKSSLSSLSAIFKDNALIKQLDAQTANLLSKLHNMESIAEQSPHKELKAQADNLKSLFVKLDSDDNQLLNPMKLFKELQDSVSSIKNLASQLSGLARDSILNLSGNIDGNMNFINQLNNYSSYMQLPLSMFNKDTTGELYMLKRGSKSKKLDPSNLTVLISLDSQNAGRIDTLLSIDKKDISTNFRLENSDIFPILKENHRELYNSLLSKGYRLVDYTFKLLDEPISIINFEAEAQKEFLKKPNSIDITL